MHTLYTCDKLHKCNISIRFWLNWITVGGSQYYLCPWKSSRNARLALSLRTDTCRYFSWSPSFHAGFVYSNSMLLAFTLCKNFVIKTTGTYRCRQPTIAPPPCRWRHRESLNYWKRTNLLPHRVPFIHVSAHSKSFLFFFSSVNTYKFIHYTYIYMHI